MEAGLFEEVSLAEIARAAGMSRWHFHRMFAALAGEPPATYLRRRRMSEICRRLVETDEPLIDLALSCGFASQASFTRAFSRHTGVSPGRYRREALRTPAYTYGRLDVAAHVSLNERRAQMEPRIVTRPGFRVVGLAGRYDLETNIQIPSLWARFAPTIGSIDRRVGLETFGVCCSDEVLGRDQEARLVTAASPAPTADSASFIYAAGVAVEESAPIPDGMVGLTIPDNRYAVFTHVGHLSGLRETTRRIWGEWLPASPYTTIEAPDLELYDERMNPETGDGEVDIYVPVG